MIETLSAIASLLAIIGSLWQIKKYFNKKPIGNHTVIKKWTNLFRPKQNEKIINFPKKIKKK